MTFFLPSSHIPYLPSIITRSTRTLPTPTPKLAPQFITLDDHLTSYLSLSILLSLIPQMASNSLRSSLHHHSFPKLHSSDTATLHSSLFLKPTPTNSSLSLSISSSSQHPISSTTATFSISPTTSTTPTTSQPSFNLDLLQEYLSTQNFRQADEETRRLVIVLAGEAAQKRGYVFFSEVQFIPGEDLKNIDELWKKHSNNRFGYSVQKRIWKQKAKEDFTKFFLKVGWMKKLDTEVEQYNYRSFPNEFMWELNDETPEGHLPLTNALRGTQLLNSILNHPAFEGEGAEDDNKEFSETVGEEEEANGNMNGGVTPLSKRVFKPDYSF